MGMLLLLSLVVQKLVRSNGLLMVVDLKEGGVLFDFFKLLMIPRMLGIVHLPTKLRQLVLGMSNLVHL